MNVKLLNKEDFDKIFSIMEEAFPKAEYRPKQKQYALLDDPRYSVAFWEQDGFPIGFIAAWELESCIFIEHFAISSVQRGKGIGSAFLKEYLSLKSKPVVLEVEDTNTQTALRRIGFYQRAGFTLTDTRYIQPDLGGSEEKIPLRLMCFGKADNAKKQIFENVYNQEVI